MGANLCPRTSPSTSRTGWFFSWGIPGSDALPPGGSTVEVVLNPDGDDTMVVLRHHGLSSTHIGGYRTCWEHQLGRLPAAAG